MGGSWETSHDFFDLFVAQGRSIRPGAQNRKSSYRIAHDTCRTWTLGAGPQHDLATFDICVQSVARANTQSSPQGAGKDNLTFRGNLGLHGKTILPYIYR
jgi:hypothetical protein